MKSGVAFVDAVVQKNDQSPADDSTEKAWGTAFNIPFDLASDPNSALGPYLDPSTFPASMVIRLSDMTIEAQWTGLMPGMTESEVDMALQ